MTVVTLERNCCIMVIMFTVSNIWDSKIGKELLCDHNLDEFAIILIVIAYLL